MLIDCAADIDNKNEFPVCALTALSSPPLTGIAQIVRLLVARGTLALDSVGLQVSKAI